MDTKDRNQIKSIKDNLKIARTQLLLIEKDLYQLLSKSIKDKGVLNGIEKSSKDK